MSEHRFTAGPWRVNTGGSQMCDPGTTICFAEGVGVFSDADYHGDKLADARLIAAAPDLLAALEALVAAGGIGQESMFRDARDAIAKATGAPP